MLQIYPGYSSQGCLLFDIERCKVEKKFKKIVVGGNLYSFYWSPARIAGGSYYTPFMYVYKGVGEEYEISAAEEYEI